MAEARKFLYDARKGYYERMTMDEKRQEILSNLQAFYESKDYEQYGGYAPLELLKDNICWIMGWVGETQYKRRGGVATYVYTKSAGHNCLATIDNMVQQGYIEISKSGKGFRVLKFK